MFSAFLAMDMISRGERNRMHRFYLWRAQVLDSRGLSKSAVVYRQHAADLMRNG